MAGIESNPFRFESHIAAYEQAWREGARPKLGAFVLQATKGLDALARQELLWELIKVDLELRWRAGQRRGRKPSARGPLLQWYVKQFPELGSLDALPLSLVWEEYRVRTRWGDCPSHAEYVARFPRGGLALIEGLAGVDVALADEGLATGEPRVRRPAKPLSQVADPDAPLPYSDYSLKRQIGAGGMSKVYTAVQISLDKPVAVKVLRKERLADVRSVQRFRREARLAASLRHAGIVDVHGLGRLPDGGYFMVLDLVAGPDLSHVGAVPPPRAAEIVTALAKILLHVHAAGVLHCDLKPQNVLLDALGNVYLTDFGLARRFGANVAETVFDEHPAGTAAYMAPEQIDARFGELGPWTDVYGLGGILYALLVGRSPFEGLAAEEILAQVTAATPPDVAFSGLDPTAETLAQIAGAACGNCPTNGINLPQKLSQRWSLLLPHLQ